MEPEATPPEFNGPDALLDAWRARRDKARRQEAKALDEAIAWLATQVGTGPEDREFVNDIPLGGDGCPELPEACVAEFAGVAGMTTMAARSYLSDAWSLKWRFPETHAGVREGRVEVWRARQIASTLQSVPLEGAQWVDEVLAPIAHQVGIARLRRMVVLAEIYTAPDAAVRRARTAAEGRMVGMHPSPSPDGLMDVFGRLDYADAQDLEAAIQLVAAELGDLGDDTDAEDIEPLDVRRSKALGVIARRQLAGESGAEGGTVVTRVVHTYVHLTPGSPIALVEQGNTIVPVERVQEWCETAGTKVIVRPVLDLAAEHSRDGYTPTETMREQAILVNTTCVHPYCEHPARDADLDHIKAYQDPASGGPPGQTSTANLAPLCRFHHRLKTHAGWTYKRLKPGHYHWQSPAGRTYLRTPSGTTALTAEGG